MGKLRPNETNLTAPRPNLLRAWWPAAVWVVLITFESTDYFSSQNTGSMLYTLLTRLFGHINFLQFPDLPSLSAQNRPRHRLRHVRSSVAARLAGDAWLSADIIVARRHCSPGWGPLCRVDGRMAPELHSLADRHIWRCRTRQHGGIGFSAGRISLVAQIA